MAASARSPHLAGASTNSSSNASTNTSSIGRSIGRSKSGGGRQRKMRFFVFAVLVCATSLLSALLTRQWSDKIAQHLDEFDAMFVNGYRVGYDDDQYNGGEYEDDDDELLEYDDESGDNDDRIRVDEYEYENQDIKNTSLPLNLVKKRYQFDGPIHVIHVLSPYVAYAKPSGSDKNKRPGSLESQIPDTYPLDEGQMVALLSIDRAKRRVPESLMKIDVVCAILETDEPVFSQPEYSLQSKGLCTQVVLNRSTATEYPLLDPPKHLPFVQDIIEASTAHLSKPATSVDGKNNGSTKNGGYYWMLTNADIGLTEGFYMHLYEYLQSYKALSINRLNIPTAPMTASIQRELYAELIPVQNSTNTIPNNSSSTQIQNHPIDPKHYYDIVFSQIDALLDKGMKHPGYDCFVLHSSVLRRFTMGDFFLGHPPWGANLHVAAKLLSETYTNVKSNVNGTFHLGDDTSKWRDSKHVMYEFRLNIPRNSSVFPYNASTTAVTSKCPVKNGAFNNYGLQNIYNCGRWVLEGSRTYEIQRSIHHQMIEKAHHARQQEQQRNNDKNSNRNNSTNSSSVAIMFPYEHLNDTDVSESKNLTKTIKKVVPGFVKEGFEEVFLQNVLMTFKKGILPAGEYGGKVGGGRSRLPKGMPLGPRPTIGKGQKFHYHHDDLRQIPDEGSLRPGRRPPRPMPGDDHMTFADNPRIARRPSLRTRHRTSHRPFQ